MLFHTYYSDKRDILEYRMCLQWISGWILIKAKRTQLNNKTQVAVKQFKFPFLSKIH